MAPCPPWEGWTPGPLASPRPSPCPLSLRQRALKFCLYLRRAAQAPLGTRTPRPPLNLGSTVMGTEAPQGASCPLLPPVSPPSALGGRGCGAGLGAARPAESEHKRCGGAAETISLCPAFQMGKQDRSQSVSREKSGKWGFQPQAILGRQTQAGRRTKSADVTRKRPGQAGGPALASRHPGAPAKLTGR